MEDDFNVREFEQFMDEMIKGMESEAKYDLSFEDDLIYLKIMDEENTSELFMIQLNLMNYLNKINYDLEVISGINPCVLTIYKERERRETE